MIWNFVSGWTEKVGDGSPIWSIADDVQNAGQHVNRFTCGADLVPMLRALTATQGAADGDGDSRVAFVVYSYGCAALFRALAKMPEAERPIIDVLVIIAGVNRVMDGQSWEDCWQIPACVRNAVCFCTVYRRVQVDGLPAPEVVPECAPIRNAGDHYRNVELFWAGVDHTNVVSLPVVRETIRDIVKEQK